jgi:hypothetical protein
MTNKVHVHVHTSDAEEQWITINGTHVKVNGSGKITSGGAASKNISGGGKSNYKKDYEKATGSSSAAHSASKTTGKDPAGHANAAALHRTAQEHHEAAGKSAGESNLPLEQENHAKTAKEHKAHAEKHNTAGHNLLVTKAGTPPASVTSHSNYSKKEYDSLINKGYDDEDIVDKWDRDSQHSALRSVASKNTNIEKYGKKLAELDVSHHDWEEVLKTPSTQLRWLNPRVAAVVKEYQAKK